MEPKKKTNKKFIVVISILLLTGVVYGGYKYIHSLSHEETDDAQVEANMNPVIPHVGGYVEKVYVSDNESVQKGDTLFTIDRRDYRISVEQAKAQLVTAQSQLAVAQAGIGSSMANVQTSIAQVGSAEGNIETAKINLRRAAQDYERYQNLYAKHSITAQQFEQAEAAKQQAEQKLIILQNQKEARFGQRQAAQSQSKVSEKRVGVAQAQVSSARAALDAAELNLGYTVVTSPIDGQLSEVDLQSGQFVQPGQALFYLVNTEQKWIVANFKETQLNKMKIGQKVGIEVDAYPSTEFEGKVTAFSPATGARFSLLPPDNATGNFVKTVQRLPVKIDFTPNNDVESLQKLRSGMNVTVDVHLN